MALAAGTVSATRFAQGLVAQFGHDPEFGFDITGCDYRQVKSTLETYGFSVHRDLKNQELVVAIRCEPDLASTKSYRDAAPPLVS